ncbi:MAG: tRNA (N6-isopentenyl adenosine(37)-C2)-methylthiotransferase MiaB, partial [Oscillospiraceae bacterium]|nr:tRNA (N6-isopentenyl adenosine(37)-C2)-methylthiotransferase MiaB [Oscillospiraceae bacterium]
MENTDLNRYIELVREINARVCGAMGRPLFCHTHSYGCQQNVSDGEKLGGLLERMGYRFTDDAAAADLVIYNTCAVREGAEDRVFGNIGALKNAKAQNPAMIICVCGCMTQQEHVAEKFRKSYPFVDILFGAGAAHRLPELLCRKLQGTDRVFETLDPTAQIVEGLPLRRQGGVRAWLPITYGCDNFCSYCVVPLVRGRERSREPAQILAEMRELIRDGYKEITLLGQNVNSYGKGLASPMNFSALLQEICMLPGDFRLRFMTSHPKDCTHELIDTIAQNDKIYSHLHLPVQSGSDRILAAMNRGYTAAQYKSLIEYARGKIPGLTLTSDIIVGFPGETHGDFEDTLALVREIGFQSLFTFVFSPRESTAAAGMEDQIPHEEKVRRFDRLLEAQGESTSKVFAAMQGEIQEVLVDGAKPKSDQNGLMTGRNKSNIVVDFEGPPQLAGKFVNVKITRAAHWALVGEIASLEKEIIMDRVIVCARELGKAMQADERYIRFMAAQQQNDE